MSMSIHWQLEDWANVRVSDENIEATAVASQYLLRAVTDIVRGLPGRAGTSTTKVDSLSAIRRAVGPFEAHTAHYDDGPYTLHQLWHSRLTHAAEKGASTPVLMKLPGHTWVRSLAKYAPVSDEGLLHFQADTDPAARRTGLR
ncbi:hypothetical protein [Nocardia alni]|uniref:hypothetical protein n=1 Tax=Nocardia alni TaxID=2815723 RepID=UPI0020B29D6F|nr:hypothetical protein [Nocardia alni]